jgi:glycosidase
MSLFTTVNWAHSTNVYEVNIRQYTQEGTFNAFAASLPRLKDMGVETLWFMPVQPIGKLHRKGTLGSYYSISDYTAVNPEFGTKESFRQLVVKAKQLGFKIMLDWVANHTAWDHVWTNTHPEFFSKNEHGGFRSPFPDWSDVIHLNYDNTALWDAMINDMLYWVKEFDIDGFRCDMAHLVRLEFWIEARKRIDAIKPLFWLAETEDVNYHQAFDASYTWEWMHKTCDFMKGHTDLHGLFDQLVRYNTLFPPEAIRLYFTSNHDENSHSGTEYDKYDGAAKLLAVFSACWNGIPLIYSGQELPNLKRLQFFDKDAIEWGLHPCQLHDFYKALLHLHSTHPALRAADHAVSTYKIGSNADDAIFSFLRRNGNQEVFVVMNFTNQPHEVVLSSGWLSSEYRDLFSGASYSVIHHQLSLSLPAFGFFVLLK